MEDFFDSLINDGMAYSKPSLPISKPNSQPLHKPNSQPLHKPASQPLAVASQPSLNQKINQVVNTQKSDDYEDIVDDFFQDSPQNITPQQVIKISNTQNTLPINLQSSLKNELNKPQNTSPKTLPINLQSSLKNELNISTAPPIIVHGDSDAETVDEEEEEDDDKMIVDEVMLDLPSSQRSQKLDLNDLQVGVIYNKQLGSAFDLPAPLRMPSPVSLLVELLPHQKIGVQWMLDQEERVGVRGGVLADGKTLQAIALIVKDRQKNPKRAHKPTLIIAPKSLAFQWQEEFFDKVQADTVSIHLYYGTNRNKDPKFLKKFDVIIVPDSTLSAEFKKPKKEAKSKKRKRPIKQMLDETGMDVDSDDEEQAEENNNTKLVDKGKQVLWDTGETHTEVVKRGPLFYIDFLRVIIDEAHKINNRSTNLAHAMFSLKADFHWALTGTPIQNKLDDFYSFLKYLQIDGNKYAEFLTYKNEIVTPYENGYEKKALKSLDAILEKCLLRRTKTQLIDGKPIITLPAIEKETVSNDFTIDERKIYNTLYNKAKKQYNAYVKAGTVMKNYSNLLTWLLRLRQICCHPSLVTTFNEQLAETEQRQIDSEKEKKYKYVDALSEVILARLMEVEFEKVECAVCMNEVLPGSINFDCGHFLCDNCSSIIVESTKICAECRAHINEHKVIPIELFLERKRADVFAEMNAQAAERQLENNLLLHEINERNPDSSHIDHKMRQIDPDYVSSTKIQQMLKYLNEIRQKSPGEKTIVFSQFVQFLGMLTTPLTANGIKFTTYTGALSMDERKVAIQKFKEDDECLVMLISFKCGSVGLNLAFANHVLMMDLWWNPQIENQAFDRVHRIGQKKKVCVKKIVIRDSIEDKLLRIQAKKQRIFDHAFDPTSRTPQGSGGKSGSGLDEEDFKTLFTDGNDDDDI